MKLSLASGGGFGQCNVKVSFTLLNCIANSHLSKKVSLCICKGRFRGIFISSTRPWRDPASLRSAFRALGKPRRQKTWQIACRESTHHMSNSLQLMKKRQWGLEQTKRHLWFT